LFSRFYLVGTYCGTKGGINYQQKIIKEEMEILFPGCFTTLQRRRLSRSVEQTYTVLQRFLQILSVVCGSRVYLAREYGGLLDNHSFGGALVSRTFYARRANRAAIIVGAYSAMNRQ
jgi:succinate dehydrogenase / fumarate reductase flavoprotein subunit